MSQNRILVFSLFTVPHVLFIDRRSLHTPSHSSIYIRSLSLRANLMDVYRSLQLLFFLS
jgi:hypothetical protein